jgi:hypothetical protein
MQYNFLKIYYPSTYACSSEVARLSDVFFCCCELVISHIPAHNFIILICNDYRLRCSPVVFSISYFLFIAIHSSSCIHPHKVPKQTKYLFSYGERTSFVPTRKYENCSFRYNSNCLLKMDRPGNISSASLQSDILKDCTKVLVVMRMFLSRSLEQRPDILTEHLEVFQQLFHGKPDSP